MPKTLNILAFFDTRPGHQFQTRGVLSALSSLTDVSVRERHVGKNAAPLGEFCPDLLLGAGRRVHVPMLKAKIQTKAKSVVLMRPTLWTFGYDLAVVPNHDRMKSHPKIIRTVLAPTTIQPSGNERCGRPLALVGGPSRHFSWDTGSLRDSMNQLDDGSGFDVITSRRTPPDTTDHLPPNSQIHKPSSVDRPRYEYFLTHAPFILVTPESVSMLADAITAGAAVHTVPMEPNLKSKVARAIAQLEATNMINAGRSSVPLNESKRVAEEILSRFFPEHLGE